MNYKPHPKQKEFLEREETSQFSNTYSLATGKLSIEMLRKFMDNFKIPIHEREKYPQIIILRDEDNNYLVGEYTGEFKEGIPEYKMKQFWAYHEESVVRREVE